MNKIAKTVTEELMKEEREKIAELLLKIDELWVLEMIYACIENVVKEQEGYVSE